MAKYNFNEVKIAKVKEKVTYGEYTTEKQQKLASAAAQYAGRHGWKDWLTRKDKENGELMLIRLK